MPVWEWGSNPSLPRENLWFWVPSWLAGGLDFGGMVSLLSYLLSCGLSLAGAAQPGFRCFQRKKAVTTHLSTLVWKIPWMEEPGRPQSMGSLRVGHDWATLLSLSCIGEGNGNPLQCSCLENPRDGGAWWAAIYGVAQSRTRLKWLSS